jgi:sugar/nucleoside kinase (ribokinase family)
MRGWLRRSGCALVNEVEATSLSGIDDTADAARALHAAMPRNAILVVKCGPDGALAIGPDGAVARAAAPKVDVVDTIGAGDVFNAAFLAALADGMPLADCLAAGTTVASRAVSTRPRSYGALPHGAIS